MNKKRESIKPIKDEEDKMDLTQIINKKKWRDFGLIISRNGWHAFWPLGIHQISPSSSSKKQGQFIGFWHYV